MVITPLMPSWSIPHTRRMAFSQAPADTEGIVVGAVVGWVGARDSALLLVEARSTMVVLVECAAGELLKCARAW